MPDCACCGVGVGVGALEPMPRPYGSLCAQLTAVNARSTAIKRRITISASFLFRLACMTRILCFLAIVIPGLAHACLFARDAQPRDWLEWANVLLAADVSGIEQEKGIDTISLRVVERFKGPAMTEAATLQIPSRMWSSCRLERPALGARVLVAINANKDALLVPLSAEYGAKLRKAIEPSAPA